MMQQQASGGSSHGGALLAIMHAFPEPQLGSSWHKRMTLTDIQLFKKHCKQTFERVNYKYLNNNLSSLCMVPRKYLSSNICQCLCVILKVTIQKNKHHPVITLKQTNKDKK